MDHHDVVLLGKGHQLLIKFPVGQGADRVGRVADHHHLGLAGDFGVDGVKIDQKAVLLPQRDGDQLHPCHQRPKAEDRVARVGHQHQVAGVAEGEGHMGDALLGAVDALDLLRGQFHPIAAAVPALHCLDHLRQVAQGVVVVFRLLGGIDQRLADVGLRLKIRGAHRQVENLPALGHQLLAAALQFLENIGPKLLHAA